MIDKEFIERAQELMKPAIIENVKEKTQYNKQFRKKYYDTDLAREKSRKRNRMRLDAWKDLTEEELEMTREFYRKRPLGYVVDHIIPLSKGGKHTVDNLQYLTSEQNSRKGNKEEFHHIFI